MAREDDPPGFDVKIFEKNGKSDIISNQIYDKNDNVA